MAQDNPPKQHGKSAPDYRLAVEGMIAEGRRAIAMTDNPERREQRRRWIDDWQQRLDAGEDPMLIYGDIFRISTEF